MRSLIEYLRDPGVDPLEKAFVQVILAWGVSITLVVLYLGVLTYRGVIAP